MSLGLRMAMPSMDGQVPGRQEGREGERETGQPLTQM